MDQIVTQIERTRASLDAMVRPRSVCVLGVSGKRATRGNLAIRSLKAWGFDGQIIPIHPQAAELEGLPVVASIEELPPGVDAAFVAVSAAQLPDTITRLDRAGVRAAVVIAAGLSEAEEEALRAVCAETALLMHGPNCMGLINLSDGVPLYSAEISPKLRRGRVALLAQSGSAAIAVMNTLDVGFSKVVTVGSEFRVTAADYLDWLADDPETSVIGIVLEAIQAPAAFVAAVRRAHAAGKSVVVLKVGRSPAGVLAAQAHTGAMITPSHAYECFFRDLGVPVVGDYEQLAASLTLLAAGRLPPPGTGVAIVGISGGETALACDLAADLGLRLAEWSDETAAEVRRILPGVSGRNPLDVGASVGYEDNGGDLAALEVVLRDPSVGMVLGLQDMQASLPRQLVNKYLHSVGVVAKLRGVTDKPLVMMSPTPDAIQPELAAAAASGEVVVLRGLPAGLVGLRSLAFAGDHVGRAVAAVEAVSPGPEVVAALRAEIRLHVGALPQALCQKILAAYGIPFVRSVMVGPSGELPPEGAIDFPVVAKIASAEITHRSDVGGVRLGIANSAALAAAIADIRENVQRAKPDAVIDGFEIQEEMRGCIEALAGFSAVPPFDVLTIVGTGGVLAEIHADRAYALGAIGAGRATAMIAETRLGQVLAGYRRLFPVTSLDGLARIVSGLSCLGADLCDVLAACDLNPVLVRPGSGEAKAVDVLLISSVRD